MLNNTKKLLRIFDYAGLCGLALIFIGAMTYVQYNMGGGGIQIPYNVMTWVALSVFVLVAATKIAVIRRVRVTTTFMVYLLCVGVLLLPLAYTNRLFLGVESLRLFGVGGAVLFIFSLHQFTSRYFKTRALQVLLLSTLVQTCWGIIQYYFVFEDSLWFIRSSYDRPFGVFQQVNVFAIYLAFGSLLSIYLCFKSKKIKLSCVIGTGVIVALNSHLIVLADSDTGRVVGLLSVIIYSLYQMNKATAKPILMLLLVAICISVAPRAWFDFRSSNLSEPEQSLAALSSEIAIIGQPSLDIPVTEKNEMFGSRPLIYQVAFNMIADKPLLGHGIGSFAKQYALYQGHYLQENPGSKGEFALNHAHNEVLQWTIELGLVSGGAFLLLFVFWCISVAKKRISPAILLITMPLVLQSLLELPFYHSAPVFLAFSMLLFLSDRASKKSIKLIIGVSFLPLLLSALATFKLLVFMFSTLYALKMLLIFNGSDRQAVTALMEVNNPAAFKLRFEFELFQWKLRKARQSRKIAYDDVIAYIYWSFSTLQYAPMESTYENFIDALILLDRDEAALKYAQEGVLIYPENKKLRSLLSKLSFSNSINNDKDH